MSDGKQTSYTLGDIQGYEFDEFSRIENAHRLKDKTSAPCWNLLVSN